MGIVKMLPKINIEVYRNNVGTAKTFALFSARSNQLARSLRKHMLWMIVFALSANLASQEVIHTKLVDEVTPQEISQADLLINLAQSLSREKRYNEAAREFKKFIRMYSWSPRMREARVELARIYERHQRFDLAADQYATLYTELGSGALGMNYYLESARLHEIMGNIDTAIQTYREINQLDPSSLAASKARERLKAISTLQKTGDTSASENTQGQTTPASKQNQLENSSPQKE